MVCSLFVLFCFALLLLCFAFFFFPPKVICFGFEDVKDSESLHFQDFSANLFSFFLG